MLMCTSANHYSILQILNYLDIQHILPEIASCQFGVFSQVLELRYFGQHKNLTICTSLAPLKRGIVVVNTKRPSQEVQGAVMSQCRAGRQSRLGFG